MLCSRPQPINTKQVKCFGDMSEYDQHKSTRANELQKRKDLPFAMKQNYRTHEQ